MKLFVSNLDLYGLTFEILDDCPDCRFNRWGMNNPQPHDYFDACRFHEGYVEGYAEGYEKAVTR